MVKNLPAMQGTQVHSLGWEDPLEEMATHSSILAWRIPWTKEPGGLQFMASQRIGHIFTFTFQTSACPTTQQYLTDNMIYVHQKTYAGIFIMLLFIIAQSKNCTMPINNRMEDLPGVLDKRPPAKAGDTNSIPGLGRFHMPWSN